MLNKAERLRILRIVRHCYTFGLIRTGVEKSSWELLSEASSNQIWKCHLFFSLFFLPHTMYTLASLAKAYFLNPSPPLHQMIIHGVLAMSGLVYGYWYLVFYVKYPDMFRFYVKTTMSADIGGTIVDDKIQRSGLRDLKEYSLHDLFVMSLPYMATAAIVAIVAALVFYPSLNLLLYSGLPNDYQTSFIFSILLVEELRHLVNYICLLVPVLVLQVISFDLVNSRLKLLIITSMQRTATARKFQRIYQSFRCIQLYMGMVNLINSFVIWTWKVLVIGTAIGSGYAAIAHFSDYPLFGVMYYILLFDASFFYTFTYDKAFEIPALFQRATQSLMLHVHNEKRPQARKLFKLQIRSIPRLGIQVGQFHMMERESTLLFCHYVLSNIVTMLVAHRHD